MSNLNSVFDTLRGWPFGSALEQSFAPKSGSTLAEGTIVKTNTDGSGGVHVEALTSSNGPNNASPAAKDDAWLVIQGNDQWDSQFVNKVSCLKMHSGITFKIQHDSANTLVPGTKVQVNAGVLEAVTDLWPVGVVVWSNKQSGSGGQIAVATY